MGERKVLNKYYPPDLDPAKIRQPKNKQMKVSMMLPMRIRCQTCGDYIDKGTKINSGKEDVVGETYLGIQMFRFYFKCKCSAEIIFRTDPQNCDYVIKSGASSADKKKRKRDEEEELGDAMKSLENRTFNSKQEIDIISNLDEMKSMKSRHARVNLDAMIEALNRNDVNKVKDLEEEDEALIRSVFHRSQNYVHRINDVDLVDELPSDNVGKLNNYTKGNKRYQEEPSQSRKTTLLDPSKANGDDANRCTKPKSSLVKISVVSKKLFTANDDNSMKEEDKDLGSSGLHSLFSNYDSNDED